MTPKQRARLCLFPFLLPWVWIPEARAQLPLGPAVPANAHHADEQRAPSVALAQDGTGVLVFSGTVYGNKHARWLDPKGLGYGPEPTIHLEGEAAGYNLFQDLAVSRKGQGAACWEDSYHGFGLCRLIDTRGHLGDLEIRCSDDPPHFGDREFEPRVETLEDGGFVAGWFDYPNPDVPTTGDLLMDPSVRFFSKEGVPRGSVIKADRQVGGELQGLDIAVPSRTETAGCRGPWQICCLRSTARRVSPGVRAIWLPTAKCGCAISRPFARRMRRTTARCWRSCVLDRVFG